MTLDLALRLWPALVTLGGIILAAALWRARGEFAPTGDVVAIHGDLAAVMRRVTSIERDMKHQPTRDDIHQLRIEFTEMRGDLREIRADGRAARDMLARAEVALNRHDDIIRTLGRGGGAP